MIKRPILRYHGAKWQLAKKILSYFPKHKIYVEPFGGSAAILLQKKRAYSECYNDINGDIVNVFRVIRDHPEELRRLCRLTPFSREEFDKATRKAIDNSDPVEAARMVIFRSFAGFGSGSSNPEYVTGFRRQSNKSGTAPCMDWKNWPEHVAGFAERLRGVCIEQEQDAIELIKKYDSDDCLIYLDPPYPKSTRNSGPVYRYEMTDDDHRQMANVISKLKHNPKIAISGYACDLYDYELFKDWYRVSFSAYADGAKKREECLWMNYRPPGIQSSIFPPPSHPTQAPNL